MLSPDQPSLLTSRSGRVKAARRLVRRPARAEHRLFLAEGPQAVREALTVPGCVREVFAVPAAGTAHPAIRAAAEVAGAAWLEVDDAALASLTETVHPQGLVAVCRFLDVPATDVLASAPDLLAVCADAAGAGGVLLAGQSVDPYNGKAVRASAGSLFHLPVATEPDTAGLLGAVRSAGLTVLAADGAGEADLDEAEEEGLLDGPTAWLFGNEAWGLPDEVAALADHRVRIPIHGRAESLNLATAAAVCLYASARVQRRRARSDTTPKT